jgi:phosphate:Na+ symporter
MLTLLNLLAAVALLVWGTQIVRTGMLRVFGETLRRWLIAGMVSTPKAIGAGLAVTGLIQSSTATALIVASFLRRSLVTLSAALATLLGADIGTSTMVVVFSFDLAWLSPLLIVGGVLTFLSREKTRAGHLGRVAIGLGLILLSLQLIVASTEPLTESAAARALLAGLPDEVLLHIVVGALLTVLAYSSLAIVLLTATLAGAGAVPPEFALGLVLGANLGSGVLALVVTRGTSAAERRLLIGHLAFKLLGVALLIPWLAQVLPWLQRASPELQWQVVLFHLGFNVALALGLAGLTGVAARLLQRWFAEAPVAAAQRPRHLDASALGTPTLAISCAAREALHQADVVETMLRGIVPVLRDNDLPLAERLRRMDDSVDELYTEIKLYLTQISREALSEDESRRWSEVVAFTINMEQIGDLAERALQDIETKKIRPNRRLSDAGLAEICHLHERLVGNLRLAMSVFLDGNLRDARRLLEEKARFRDLQHGYAANHLARLQDNTPHSIDTSSLHLDLISDLKRINSHICSIAYPILESAGALSATRIRPSGLMPLDSEPTRSE